MCQVYDGPAPPISALVTAGAEPLDGAEPIDRLARRALALTGTENAAARGEHSAGGKRVLQLIDYFLGRNPLIKSCAIGVSTRN